MNFLKHLYKDLEDYLFSQDEINEIFQIFKDFYGEDKVDIQLNTSLEQCISLLSNMSLSDFAISSEYPISLMNCIKDKIKDLITKYKKDKNTCIEKFVAVNSISVYIIVYFPKITVTNEYNESIDIEEVYIRVPINLNGRMNSSFEIIRTKYSYIQYESGYMHSHAYAGISGNSTDWRYMCLGSGPLVTTTHTLKNSYDLDIWRLFCIELDEYLKVESVAGVPYVRMNRIGDTSNYINYVIRDIPTESQNTIRSIPLIKDFLKFLFHKLLVENTDYFSFRDKSICLALSNEQFAIIISKYFIEYYNSVNNELDINSIIINYLVKVKRDINGILRYEVDRRNNAVDINSNNFILCFKGKSVHIKVDIPKDINESKHTYLLKPNIVSSILNYLINIVNYGNTKEFTTNSKIPYFL